MRWIDRISLPVLALVAGWLAIAPVFPEPHLIEKLRMLAQGTLRQPMDIFDLLLHAVPLVLLLVRLWRMLAARRAGGPG
jgi:uncharacterized membrane protein